MTKKESTLYHFGAICGLVGKQSAEVQAHPESPLAKRVSYHVARLCRKWKKIVSGELTPGEKFALAIGQAQGLKEREEITA